MSLSNPQRQQIRDYLVGKIQEKLAVYNPETRAMPFHFRLIGKDRMALFSFIQSVNTMLGTSIFEQIGKMIAEPRVLSAIGQYRQFEGHISSEAVLKIDTIMRELRSATRVPNKIQEVEEIATVAKKGEMGKKLKKRVDLFIQTQEGTECYFELKTAKPNINEFTSVKKQLLDWVAMRKSQDSRVDIKTFVAIPYNPYEPQPYERWTLQGLFDIPQEVLVGWEFWDFLGGKGTYEDLLRIFEQAGQELDEAIGKKMKLL